MPPHTSDEKNSTYELDHPFPPHQKSTGPLFGTGIIIALLLIGAFYFLSGELHRRNANTQLPLIPASDTTLHTSLK